VGNGKEYSSVQAAVNDASCGDTIDIYAGKYIGNVEVDVSGETCTSGNYLTIRAAEPGVTLDGNEVWYAIKISEPYTVLDGNGYGFNITGGAMKDKYGSYNERLNGALDLESADYAVIDDVHITGTVGGDNSYCHGNKAPCSVSDLWIDNSDHVTIQNSTFTSRYAKYGVNVGSTSKYLTFKNNVVGDAAYITSRFYQTHNALFEKNYIYQTFSTTSGSSGFLLRDSNNVTIRYNIFENTAGKPSATLWDDANGTGAENWDFYNNIFIGYLSLAGSSDGSHPLTNLTFKNNIFSHTSHIIVFPGWATANSNITFDHNLWYTCTGSSSCVDNQNGSTYTWDQNPTYASPDFAGGKKPSPYFQPLSSSAYQVDTGGDVGYAGTDYLGNKVPNGNGTDIGAFEYTSDTLIADVPPNPPLLISID
jgi:hypothetical protein